MSRNLSCFIVNVGGQKNPNLVINKSDLLIQNYSKGSYVHVLARRWKVEK